MEDRLLVAPTSQLTYFDVVEEPPPLMDLDDPADDRDSGFHQEAVTDMDWFVRSAFEYRTRGAPFSELCEHNEEVADALGRPEVAIAWANFRIMYGCSDDDYDQELWDAIPPEYKAS